MLKLGEGLKLLQKRIIIGVGVCEKVSCFENPFGRVYLWSFEKSVPSMKFI